MASPPPRTPGKWLVDLGRDYPLSPQASVSDADAELTLAFMTAAARIEPSLAEAYLWQYNMLWALERETEARAALQRYVEATPGDASAALAWISLETDALQTAEERYAFWSAQLEHADRPPEVISDLHRRLAEYHFNRGERDEAMRHADAALAAYPDDVAALVLRFRIDHRENSSPARLALGVKLAALAPQQPILLWDVARVLDDLARYDDAQRWYQWATAAFQRVWPDEPAPIALRLDLAASQAAANRLDVAQQLLDGVYSEAPKDTAALIALAHLAKQRGDTNKANEWLDAARAVFATNWTDAAANASNEQIAAMAWFYCAEDPQPDRAMAAARHVLAAGAANPLAERAYGWALMLDKRYDEARRILEPMADADPWAAIALARVCAADQQKQRAVALATRVAANFRSGPVFDAARETLETLGAPVPPAPGDDVVRAAMGDFDSTILQFPADPAKFCSFRVTPIVNDDNTVHVSQPVWCRLTLTNRAPFRVSLGADRMLQPSAVLSVRSTGDRERIYGGLERITLDRRLFLAPGESLEVTQTIDVGPLRATLVSTPQAEQVINVEAILNAVYDPEDRAWKPGTPGLSSGPVRIVRKPAAPDDPGPLGLAATMQTLASGDDVQRSAALDRLMMWLAEDGHLRANRVRYPVGRLDIDRLRAEVLRCFADPRWLVRAHLAESLRWIVLDNEFAKAASALLSDKNWLVRMLTIRMYADQQGAKFDNVAAYYAENDPDPLVRSVAAALRQRWAAETQPAEGRRQGKQPSRQAP